MIYIWRNLGSRHVIPSSTGLFQQSFGEKNAGPNSAPLPVHELFS